VQETDTSQPMTATTRKGDPMVTLMMNQTDIDGVRPVAPSFAPAPRVGCNWRFGPVDAANGGTTGLFANVCSMYATGTNHTAGVDKHTINRPARHLGTRST